MRVYLPAVLDDLDGQVLPGDVAHAVTPELRAALPDEDEEGLEFLAQLAAADASLALLAARTDAPRLRLVVSVDVAESAVAELDDPGLVPSAVALRTPVRLADVVCVHVDEPDARADVAAVLAGDEGAQDRLDERDLLWYDATELVRIPR
ncbi:DUF6912 family protein [Cellulomonas fimi]|uniref:Mucin-2 n=1 Tax=Cellulomonas fimi (strain ATCC 484 / DSM 20113 / JCM 1341 / CCUG 24087 / LMG 16345 / NBRC 15513 / NCIMB 8980 / NCTC 7547 / NRS-133) TaxID=590998 RepID=F4H4A9_CELFA|nr:hypothetical protein [Cellulomonas fimi]AEE46585.1 hypothetical protein Celf_2459 [Cellulomonas fimi ATCC 484]NNH08509.1 hypothetical protein [Cellulomonas fimi]VEH33587.1 Uncharacterised protein [Cellulomonas fimi]